MADDVFTLEFWKARGFFEIIVSSCSGDCLLTLIVYLRKINLLSEFDYFHCK